MYIVANVLGQNSVCNRQFVLSTLGERQTMVCAPVRRDNLRALARGLSMVKAHKPCSISLVP